MLKRLLMGAALAVAFFAVSHAPASAGITYPPSTSGSGTTYTSASPLYPYAGGLGPYILPTPAAGSTDFYEGDSITHGYLSTSCSLTSSTPSGNCFSDLVSVYDGAAEINVSVIGTCLIYSTTSGSVCNASSTTTGSVAQRYNNDNATLTAGMRYHLMIGTNDLNAYSLVATDPLINPSAFRSNLVTVLSAAAAKVCPTATPSCLEQNVILEEIPWSRHFYLPMWEEFNATIADVAAQYGYSLAATANTIQLCALQNFTTDATCQQTDFLHPSAPLGYAAIATAIEGASYQSAISERTAQATAVGLSFAANFGSMNSHNYVAGFYAGQVMTGTGNVIIGPYSAQAYTTGGASTIIGDLAGKQTTSGNMTLVGNNCGSAITTGSANNGFGQNCLQGVATGGNNLGLGSASATGANCAAVSNSIFIGNSTTCKSTSDTDEDVVGYQGQGNGSHTFTIGALTITKVITPGGVCPNTGAGAVVTGPCYYAGTGAPSFSAPSGSEYLRYDGATGSRVYYNTSTASSSGTTWTAETAI